MRVTILGAGAYGFALASILNKNKNSVVVWSFDINETKELNSKRKSPKLKGYKIPKEIVITNDLKESLTDTDLVIISVPAFAFEETTKKMNKFIDKKVPVVIATKGIQRGTCRFLHDVFTSICKNSYAIISGPTFAYDIIKDVPIGLTLATKSNKVEETVRNAFENDKVRFRRSRDIVGVEICASIKNVIAIASGMLEGMKVTDSTRALFLTESINDIKELIYALGGRKKTILSYAGFGDILMTCTSEISRNFSFGYLIGSGASKKEIDNYLKNTTVEGMYTLESIHKLVRKKKVKIPIINLIHDIINGTKDKNDIYKFLITKN